MHMVTAMLVVRHYTPHNGKLTLSLHHLGLTLSLAFLLQNSLTAFSAANPFGSLDMRAATTHLCPVTYNTMSIVD